MISFKNLVKMNNVYTTNKERTDILINELQKMVGEEDISVARYYEEFYANRNVEGIDTIKAVNFRTILSKMKKKETGFSNVQYFMDFIRMNDCVIAKSFMPVFPEVENKIGERNAELESDLIERIYDEIYYFIESISDKSVKETLIIITNLFSNVLDGYYENKITKESILKALKEAQKEYKRLSINYGYYYSRQNYIYEKSVEEIILRFNKILSRLFEIKNSGTKEQRTKLAELALSNNILSNILAIPEEFDDDSDWIDSIKDAVYEKYEDELIERAKQKLEEEYLFEDYIENYE